MSAPREVASAAIEAALRETTERLANELARPTEAPPDWSDFEWLIARAVAAMHGISALLCGTLRWRGSAEWHEFLEEQRDHTVARYARIEQLLRLLDDHARRDGIALVALKGAELYARGLYAPGERPMADIDLLVRSADRDACARLLNSLDYHGSFTTWKHEVFVPPHASYPPALGEHADNYLKVELHERIREALPLQPEEITDWVFPARPHAGLNAYPSHAALMLHLLLHAAGDMVFRGLRLVQLHDIALLALRLSGADWDAILAARAPGRSLWWAWPPLCLTARYYTNVIPTRILSTTAADCHRRLRRAARGWTLSDVSLSHLSVDAFPGIDWTPTVAQRVRYVTSRLRPDKATLALRGELARTQLSAAASEWSHLSQWQRMLRWLASRPARPETLYPIRMALAQARKYR